MGRYADALVLEEPPEPRTRRHETLVGLRADVEPDGEATNFNVHYSHQDPFKVRIPLLQVVSVMNELRAATLGMLDRQRLKLDRGASYIQELCEQAKRPSVVQVMVDPITKDRTFIFQFENEAPVTVRISAQEMPVVLTQLAKAVARSSN